MEYVLSYGWPHTGFLWHEAFTELAEARRRADELRKQGYRTSSTLHSRAKPIADRLNKSAEV